jgi:hypothetical protein
MQIFRTAVIYHWLLCFCFLQEWSWFPGQEYCCCFYLWLIWKVLAFSRCRYILKFYINTLFAQYECIQDWHSADLTFLLNCCSFYITGISQHLLWWKECQVNGHDLLGMHHGKTTGWELLDHYFNYLLINEWLRVCSFSFSDSVNPNKCS